MQMHVYRVADLSEDIEISQKQPSKQKCFRQKLYGFKGDIRWYHWFDLEELFEGHMKVTFNFLNGTYYLSLHSCSLSRELSKTL